ncbi:MAG: hypothetical protein IJX47_02335 [Clostridia bacterium]|nr:hypothetical protein [Clostridia bacterium]
MDERKFADDEILKALILCSACTEGACDECPYNGIHGCTARLESDNIALIERQKAEITNLYKKLVETSHFYNHRQCVKIEESRTNAVSEYIESVKYELCMTNGLEENKKIFEILDRIGDKYATQKASEEA